jgi:hypothetical protein
MECDRANYCTLAHTCTVLLSASTRPGSLRVAGRLGEQEECHACTELLIRVLFHTATNKSAHRRPPAIWWRQALDFRTVHTSPPSKPADVSNHAHRPIIVSARPVHGRPLTLDRAGCAACL